MVIKQPYEVLYYFNTYSCILPIRLFTNYYSLQHCKCEDYFEQTEPTLNGNYKRICNKKTIEEGKFINGNKDGIWKTWSKKGTLIRVFNYSNGIMNGEVKFYNSNGSKKFEGMFENGYKNGNWAFYNDKGGLIKTGNYNKGVPTGIWKIFDWKAKKELYVYDFETKKYLKRESESTYFESAAIMQNDNTQEWYILHYPKRKDTSNTMPIEGYILSNDIYVNLMEVPLDIWDTYLQNDFNVSLNIQSNEIQSISIVKEDSPQKLMFTFLVTTNDKDKLKEVNHSDISIKLLEYKIMEVLWLMGPWIGNNGNVTIETAYVVNKFKNSPF
ncbi:MAG: hypothetical protein IPP60_05535 [Sphingobacteriales bacterium]|nr:hypothetical protein [Sphingobacteriales bacterium]